MENVRKEGKRKEKKSKDEEDMVELKNELSNEPSKAAKVDA